jgi:hypothetical protein
MGEPATPATPSRGGGDQLWERSARERLSRLSRAALQRESVNEVER